MLYQNTTGVSLWSTSFKILSTLKDLINAEYSIPIFLDSVKILISFPNILAGILLSPFSEEFFF